MARTTPTSTRPQYLRSQSSTTTKPTRDKPRLYIVLYPRGGSSTASSFRNVSSCDSHHWALLVGPQTACGTDAGTRYHVAHLDDSLNKYLYEEQDLEPNVSAQKGLVRITVCKVTDEQRRQLILRGLPVRGDDIAFSCLAWVREAFCKLHDDGKAVKSYLKSGDWGDVERCARKYCKRKRDVGRFQEARSTIMGPQ